MRLKTIKTLKIMILVLIIEYTIRLNRKKLLNKNILFKILKVK